jgi:hypothetical protein
MPMQANVLANPASRHVLRTRLSVWLTDELYQLNRYGNRRPQQILDKSFRRNKDTGFITWTVKYNFNEKYVPSIRSI